MMLRHGGFDHHRCHLRWSVRASKRHEGGKLLANLKVYGGRETMILLDLICLVWSIYVGNIERQVIIGFPA
jgi:hypothetical protein